DLAKFELFSTSLGYYERPLSYSRQIRATLCELLSPSLSCSHQVQVSLDKLRATLAKTSSKWLSIALDA
ncbi:hypothetical protein PanWU01x14_184550, partial [Parasponia andersonii]